MIFTVKDDKQELKLLILKAFKINNKETWQEVLACNIQQISYFFNDLISNIFSFEWLNNVPCDIFNLILDPNGKLFSYVCEITFKTNLKYEFPLCQMPAGFRSNICIGKMDEFYQDKINILDNQLRIMLNAFEFYFFKMAYSIIFLFMKKDNCNLDIKIDFFLTILQKYYDFFLPNSRNHQYFIQTSLYKERFIWQIKTFIKILVDFWLKQIPLYELPVYIGKKESLHCLEMCYNRDDINLLTGDKLSCLIIMLIKNIHNFSIYLQIDSKTSIDIDSSDIIAIKKECFDEYVACLLYSYLRYIIVKYPSNIEHNCAVWLTFVRPWRYNSIFCNQLYNEYEGLNKINTKWYSFIEKYLPFYTVLLQHILDVIIHLDLDVFHKTIYIISKNFASLNNLKEMIHQALNKNLKMGAEGNVQVVDSCFFNLCQLFDSPSFLSTTIFSYTFKSKILQWLTILSNKIKDLRPKNKENNWFDKFLSKKTSISSSEMITNLENVFNIWNNFFELNAGELLSEDNDGFFDDDDEIKDVSLPPNIQKKIIDDKFEYDLCSVEDPEQTDIRTTEFASLARLTYQLSSFLNVLYEPALIRATKHTNWKGYLSRLIFAPSPIVFLYKSPITPGRPAHDLRRLHPNLRPFVRQHQATPRIHLRWLARKSNVLWLGMLAFFCCFYCDISIASFIITVLLLVCILVFFIRVVLLSNDK